ncbi:anthrone oxygenase family protein [Jiangella endophytica]|uniref:anthrone oxygenase family protein n=1 Tax=Jiangella endophytica TaxID=1623398 RepID=UPI000E34BE7B|nr:DUF1772 domain-containing protein [Jiangella endophytica]
MDVLGFVVIVVVGFTAAAEFGSYAFVHPVIRRLPPEHHVRVEQGLLRTFGIVMPPLMTASLVLAITNAARGGTEGGPLWLRVAAAVAWGLGIVSTVLVNVPINLATLRWDPDAPPESWQHTRSRWEWFQGFRSWMYLLSFVLVTWAATAA